MTSGIFICVDANFWFGDVAASETSLRLELGLQNKKDSSGVGRRSLLRRSSQSSVSYGKRARERESSENNELPFYNFYTPFLYPCVLYVSFTPVKHRAPCRCLISSLTWFDWFHKYWRLPATKVIVRRPILSGVRNSTWRANLAPPWIGEEYSLTIWIAFLGRDSPTNPPLWSRFFSY
jgi:hypothetical protein